MIVDLEDKDITGTFELQGGGKVHLRLLTANDLKEMHVACFRKRADYPLVGEGKDARYQRFEYEEFDAEKFTAMGHVRNIVGWEDIYDRNEKPIPVTPENKNLLMERVPSFAEAVREGNKVLKAREKEQTEALEKNS